MQPSNFLVIQSALKWIHIYIRKIAFYTDKILLSTRKYVNTFSTSLRQSCTSQHVEHEPSSYKK